MKKIAVFLLSMCLCLISFSGCSNKPKTNVWDGTVAKSFAKGNGSEKAPFIIKKASQLAYLASEINSGKDYTGKYISLACDLDLNHIEWTPIGNGTYSFMGFFDGGDHVISNMKITKGMSFITNSSSGETAQYTAGLFGSCMDAVIKGITVNKAEIVIQNTVDRYTIISGVLIGTMRSEASAEISDINVVDASITCNFEQEKIPMNLRVGGIIGYVYGNENSSLTVENMNAEATISIADGKASYNLVGGIVGEATITNLFDVSNCASDLSVKVDTENCYMQKNYFGAFGSVSIRDNTIAISNLFSKITTNMIYDTSHGYSAYNANVIIGETAHAKQNDGTVIGGYKFQNCFGFVEQINELTGETAKSTQLYELPDHAVFTEVNCQGCEQLPTNHGFDVTVWDLSDLSNPKIKNR